MTGSRCVNNFSEVKIQTIGRLALDVAKHRVHLAAEGSSRRVSRRVEGHWYLRCGKGIVARVSNTAMQCVQDVVLREDLQKKEQIQDAFSLVDFIRREVGSFLERRCTCLLDSSVAQGRSRK